MAKKTSRTKGLTAKHKAFADHYMRDPERSGRQAYKKVYPRSKDSTADVNSSILLKNTKVREYIAEIEKKAAEETLVTNKRIIKEYARIAFLDIRKMFDENGKLKKITDLDDDTAAAIAGMDISTFMRQADDEEAFMEIVKKIKSVDKKGALDSLAKILGMFVEKIEVYEKKVLIDV